MHLVSRPKCIAAWKNATKRQVQELYCILSHGYSSPFLIDNIPYTEEGKFVCLDTEYTKRKVKMFKVRRHLSEEMQLYWDLLTSRAE